MPIGNGLNYGFSSMALYGGDAGDVFVSNILGSLSATIKGDLKPTVGGAAGFPIAVREGRSSGELSITIKEKPDTLEKILNTGTVTDATSASYTVSDVRGSTISDLVFAEKSGGSPVKATYIVTATADDAISVSYINENGTFGPVAVTAISSTAKDVGSLDIQVSLASGQLTVGDVGEFSLAFATNGKMIAVPQVKVNQEFALVTYTAPGGSNDRVNVYNFPRVSFAGCDVMLTDDDMSDVELTGMILAPDNGGSIFTRSIL